MWDLHFKMKLLQPHHLQSTNNPKPQSLHEHQQETENNPTDLENLYPQTCLKKEEGCGFQETSRNLEVFFIKVSKNKRRTYLTNFITVSITNGHKTKLNSNFVLALLLFIDLSIMSEANSPTNRNLILTSTDLQLMNSIVPKPYMILMKC